MRLRPLTEAECYARCYGGARTEQVSVLRDERDPARPVQTGEPARTPALPHEEAA